MVPARISEAPRTMNTTRITAGSSKYRRGRIFRSTLMVVSALPSRRLARLAASRSTRTNTAK